MSLTRVMTDGVLLQCDSTGLVPPIEERLGVTVDAETGALRASPAVPGVYAFNLSAVDTIGGNRSVIRTLEVEVSALVQTFHLVLSYRDAVGVAAIDAADSCAPQR